MVFDEYQCIFIHINRTAGASIEAMLGARHSGSDHETAEEIKDRVGKKIWRTYFKFCVVRNPWDRMISIYLNRSKDKRIKNPNFKDWVVANRDKLGKKKYMRTQSFWIMNSNNLLVDYTVRYEKLSQGLRHVTKILKLKYKKLPHLHNRKKGNYKSYYDKTTRDIVGDAFQIDIDNFKYKF